MQTGAAFTIGKTAGNLRQNSLPDSFPAAVQGFTVQKFKGLLLVHGFDV
jgi:hypothetical protein